MYYISSLKGMNFLKKALCVLISVLTLLNTAVLPASSLYRGVLGDVYYAHSRQIGAGVDFTLYESVTDGLNERAYVFEYRPGEGALPLVSWGDFLMGKDKTTALAKNETDLGNNVIGGVNGDFYSIYTGIPMGAVIRDGRIISDDDKNNAVGFTEDGDAIFGDPGISFSILHTYERPVIEKADVYEDSDEEIIDDFKYDRYDGDFEKNESDDYEYETVTEYLPVSYFNKYPTEWGAYLVDNMFDTSTRSQKSSLEIVIELDSKKMAPRANEIMYGTVIEVNDGVTDTEIPEGCVVISVCDSSAYRSNYNNVKVGSSIEIEFKVAEGWEDVVTAIGGSDLIVVDGEVNTDAINESHEKVANPRTAVGVREDGTVIFFAADGRSDDSYGFRLVSLAKTLISFGCVTAINLDGGGSTTAIVKYPSGEYAGIVNSPSDIVERPVANALLLVDNSVSDGIAKYIIPDVTDPVILPDETYTFTGKFYDSALNEVVVEHLDQNDVTLSFDYSRLSYYNEENMPGLGTISDDGKTYTADSVTGEIPLLFTADYNGEKLTGRTILFVAPAPDSVEILLGGLVYTESEKFPIDFDAYYRGKPVPANPKHLTFALTDFEVRSIGVYDDAEKLADCSIGYISAEGEFVPYTGADGSAWLTISLDGIPMSQTLVATGSPYITALENKSVYYDFTAGSAVKSDIAADTDQEAAAIDIAGESYTPEDIVYTSDLVLDNAMSLDIYAGDSDLTFYACVIDFSGEEHLIEYIKQENEPDDNGIYHYRAYLGGNFSALSQILNISAKDNEGKSGIFELSRAQISFDDTETIFYDTFNHWSRKNVNALYNMGIVGGEQHNGKLRFAPDRTLTRAEFAVMISKALGYNTEDYTQELVFDDSSLIAEWAYPYVRTVSENKIMNGKKMADGSLCFDPAGNITRQEIMQVIGNIIKSQQKEDYIEAIESIAEENEVPTDEHISDEAIAELNEEFIQSADEKSFEMPDFADKDDIAPWAYENVLLTLEAKIITGYEDNTLKPARNVTRAEVATVILRYLNYTK